MMLTPPAYAVGVSTGVLGDDALLFSAQNGNLHSFRALLTAGINIATCDSQGFTALHWASQDGNQAIIEELLTAGPHLEARTLLEGFTPLLLAAQNGHTDAMRTLIAAGADLGAHCYRGKTAVHLLVSRWAEYYNPKAPQQLAALLNAATESGALDLQLSPMPLDMLLLKPEGSPGVWHPWSYTPQLIRLLVAAGCRVDAPLSGSLCGTTLQEWLHRVVSAAGDTWPRRITDKHLLATASQLLQCAAASAADTDGFKAHGTHEMGAAYLATAIRSGSLDLVKVVLEAFPGASRWEGQESRSPVSLALEYLLPLPPQESWVAQYMRRALHWCELTEFLLGAGCQPVVLTIKGFPSKPLMDAPYAALELPHWAVEPLSFLPLVAAGLPWTEATHSAFPPAFRQAVKTLLLANEHLHNTRSSSRLPPELMQHILKSAARPLPYWSPQLRYFLPSGQ